MYGTLIDAGCLVLLWRLTRREGIGLFDLAGFERARIVRDALLGFALIPLSLVFILGGTYAAGGTVYGALTPPYLLVGRPAIAGCSLWLLVTYNGYLLPGFQVLCRSTSVAIAVVAFARSLQHVFMPLTFHAKFMTVRLLVSVPFPVLRA